MKSALLIVSLVSLTFSSPLSQATEGPANLVPLESFFAEPDVRSLQLSPDGKHLAFLTTLGTGRVGIALMALDTGKVAALVAAKDENIRSFFWKGSDYIVYTGDIGGNESYAIRSISISKRKVTPLAESWQEFVADRANFAQIIDTLRFDPNHILVYGNKDIGSLSVQYWTLDIRTGERRSANTGPIPPGTLGYVADNNGVLRARSRLSGDKAIFEVRPDPDGPFVRVAEFPADDPRWSFEQFAADNRSLYVINREGRDFGALQVLDMVTQKLSEPIFARKNAEPDSLLFSYDRSRLYGVSYLDEKLHYEFFDPGRATLQKQIDASLPGTTNSITSVSADEKTFVVVATSDRDPGTYYILDLHVPRLSAVGRINHLIDPAKMRPMEPISFTARDGLLVHGYLTRPTGSGPAPMIVNPHGGPFGIRDEWGFNPEVQFLANRGYAVLQINYRGSGGYGTSFMEAGKKEWGGKMQDDLTDGVKWAIEQGVTRADSVAIYGASYGGYAALVGVTQTPDLYRAAINYVGVSDLNHINSWSKRSGDQGSEIFYKEWIGDEKDYKFSHSPVNFVQNIQVPTFHAYGFNDPRVDIEHWKRLEPKLKQYGKTYEFMILGNEGHGFHKEDNRLAFYHRMEQFLDKYFPAKPMGKVELKESKIVEMPAKGTDR